MKKFGFTLMELLVSLAVVGIIAAVGIPQLVGMFPDENKMKVLKIQKQLTEINAELLNDKSLYFPEVFNNNIVCQGLNCNARPLNLPDNDDYIGSAKYPLLLAKKLNYDGNNSKNFMLKNFGIVTFYTSDGIRWATSLNDGLIVVTVDFDDDEGSNCTYSNTCSNPDRFSFNIDTYGKVTGRDALTKAYLENPNKLNDKARDCARAKEILGGD